LHEKTSLHSFAGTPSDLQVTGYLQKSRIEIRNLAYDGT